jgi:hypothetical protein
MCAVLEGRMGFCVPRISRGRIMLNSKFVRTASTTVVLSMICFSAVAQMTISGTPPATATVGKEYYFVPVVHNANQAQLQFNYIARPAWSSDYRGNGAIIGTPTAPGVYPNIQIQAWDGVHFAVTAPFTITVLAAGATAPSAQKGEATLSWSKPADNTDGTPLTNLAGYVVRYGTNPAALSSQISVASANTTDVEINNLSPGNWYFEVASVNAANMQSQFSSAVSKTIP